MNCVEFEHEWAEQIETRTPCWSLAAEQHLHDCAECQSLVRADAQVDAAITAWRNIPMPVVSTSRLLTAVLAERKPRLAVSPESSQARTKSLVQTGWVTVTAAATLMIVGWSLWQPSRISPREPAALAQTTEDSVPVTATVAELWLDVREGSASAARRTVTSWDQFPAMTPFARPDFARTEAPPPEALREELPTPPPAPPRSTSSELLSGWSNLSKPLGQQVGTAFQFLGTVLPDDHPPAS